jgi:hypothetical protein
MGSSLLLNSRESAAVQTARQSGVGAAPPRRALAGRLGPCPRGDAASAQIVLADCYSASHEVGGEDVVKKGQLEVSKMDSPKQGEKRDSNSSAGTRGQ